MTISMIAASVSLVLQAATGSIQGVVISSAANKPIGGAQVTAVKLPSLPPVPNGGVVSAPERAIVVTGVVGGIVGGGTLTPGDTAGRIGAPVQIPPATTDTNGHFAFANLEAGTYLLRASADGYAQQEFNTRPGDQPGMSTQVTLSAGQAVNNAVLHLTPGGTVSGRVTGSNGEPLVNIEVSLLRRVYDITGRTNFQSAGLAQTNDRGEYRLFWVAPGKYYLSAASSNRPIPGVPFNPGGRGNKYPRTYYPATTDVAAAAMIDVQPAVELSGLDFRLTEQQTYRVRGRVVDPTSGQTPRAVSISIVPRNPIVNSGMSSSGSPYNPSDGTFELRDVPAGSYRIIAQVTNFAREPGQPFVTPPMATALVDVGGADVDGIVLTITPPISISGRIRVEGASSQSILAASIMLRPASPGPVPAPLRPAQANAEGIFTLEGVPPGEYSVTVNAPIGAGQQGTAYVKEIRFGGKDVLSQPLVVTGPVSDTMEVVLSTNAGQITGTVRTDSQQPLTNTQVVIVPDQRARYDLFKVAPTNASGQFSFRSVPPGSYKVFAWQNVERNSWFDPAVLAVYEQYGMPVTVGASSNVTIDLKVIR